MNRIKYIAWIIFFGVTTVLLSACNSTPPDEFDFETLQMIDTTVRNEKKLLELELDSICLLQMDSLISTAIDSVKKVRIQEILDILSEESLNE